MTDSEVKAVPVLTTATLVPTMVAQEASVTLPTRVPVPAAWAQSEDAANEARMAAERMTFKRGNCMNSRLYFSIRGKRKANRRHPTIMLTSSQVGEDVKVNGGLRA